MYLKLLEIYGFKSFAKKGLLEFKTPISAIVGPNGSGKSNIAEAFRFVLGEQSLKLLRGKRGEDLIFSGSKNERTMNRAGVKVVFDNTSRFLNIDYDDVIIERVVYRDGGNHYFINKSRVRLKDVTELLAGANIGSSGHHIISQGEADRILSVNSKERKGIIEEALGLKVYQYKISESEKKLSKVEENIKSVQSLRREIAPHLKFLSNQVKKVEESLELRKELRESYKIYFKREELYLKYQKENIEKDKEPLKKRIDELEESLIEAKKILSKVKEDEVENEEILKLEEELLEIRDRKSNLSREVGRLEGMISFEERRIQREIDNQKKEEERTIKFKEVKSFIDEIKIQINRVEITSLIKTINEIINNFILKNSSHIDNEKEVIRSSSELNNLEKEKEVKEELFQSVLEEERNILATYDVLSKQIELEKSTSQKAEVKVFEIKAEQSKLNSKLNFLLDLEKRIYLEDEDYKKELNEAFALGGREAIQFLDVKIEANDVISEPREAQRERRRKLERIKIKLEDMGGNSSEDIIKEYNEVQERDVFLNNEVEDLEKSAISLKKLILELKEKLDVEFKEGLEKIDKQFNEFFIAMFGGGQANLLVVKNKKRKNSNTELGLNDNDEEEDNDGIDVSVSLPNKKTKGLQMLSGGERSLTSIAFLFAMSQIKPPPFIILDETDAALDEANSRRYGDMITNLSVYSQLILITHNRETMSRAGVLYGITMGGNGVSKLLSIELDEAVKVAK